MTHHIAMDLKFKKRAQDIACFVQRELDHTKSARHPQVLIDPLKNTSLNTQKFNHIARCNLSGDQLRTQKQ